MKDARWLALLLLVISLACCMWQVAGVSVNLFMQASLPDGGRDLNAGEVIAGGLIGMICPITLVFASGMIWLVFIRRRGSAADMQTPASYHQPAAPAAVAVSSNGHANQALLFNQYLDTMTELLMTSGPNGMAIHEDLLGVVQAHSRQVLHLLDAYHRGRVVQFLYTVRCLHKSRPVNLQGLDLRNTDLRFLDLRHAALRGANLQGSALTGTLLHDTDLSGSDLRDTDLRLAQLDRADLARANLQRSKLHHASLREARLTAADLQGANLWEADLTNAYITIDQLQAARS